MDSDNDLKSVVSVQSDCQFRSIMLRGSTDLQKRLLQLMNRRFRLNKTLEELREMVEDFTDCAVYEHVMPEFFSKNTSSKKMKKEDLWAANVGRNEGRVKNRVDTVGEL